MADNADNADLRIAADIASGVARARAPIPAGVAGDCDRCEWWMPRLVDGLCGFCRDGRPRPADWEPPTPPEQQALTPQENSPMVAEPSKSVTFVASGALLIELKRRVTAGASYNRASLDLLEAAIAAPQPTQSLSSLAPWENPEATPRERMIELVDGMAALVVGLIAQADAAAATLDQGADLAAAVARGDAAEQELVRKEEALNGAIQRAFAAETKLGSLRAALAD